MDVAGATKDCEKLTHHKRTVNIRSVMKCTCNLIRKPGRIKVADLKAGYLSL